jgi:hypothetical protein
MGEKKNACRILVEKRPLGSPRRRWMDNIKMVLREIGENGVDWTDRARDKDQCEYGIEPSGSMKCWEVLEWLPN